MRAMFETIATLDAKGDYHGLHALLQDALSQVNQLISANGQLLIRARYQAAYLVSKHLAAAGVRHPIAAFAQGIGGVLFGDETWEAVGRSHLAAAVDAFTPAQQAMFFNKVVQPVTYRLIDWHIAHGQTGTLPRLLEILKAGTPGLREVFDLTAEAPPFDIQERVRAGRERARLVEYECPPAGARGEPKKAVVAMRRLYFEDNPKSRPHDVGPRICAAMNAYGWKADFCGFDSRNAEEGCRAIAGFCLREQPDVLILDDHILMVANAQKARDSLIAALRQRLPSLKTVAVHLDAWLLPPASLKASAGSFDLFWLGGGAGMPVWEEPVFRGRIFNMPLPHAGNFAAPAGPLPEHMSFQGAFEAYNWHRICWWTAARQRQLPIGWQVSAHTDDGLSALDSYAAYMRRIAAAGISLNFSMRPDLSKIVTGRVWEALVSGALLVTENCADMDRYLISGEHYLGFSTLPELASIARFLVEYPKQAETVRRQGHAFVREHYNDDRIIGCLDRLLHHPACPAHPNT